MVALGEGDGEGEGDGAGAGAGVGAGRGAGAGAGGGVLPTPPPPPHAVNSANAGTAMAEGSLIRLLFRGFGGRSAIAAPPRTAPDPAITMFDPKESDPRSGRGATRLAPNRAAVYRPFARTA
jgi:hypothetical protein